MKILNWQKTSAMAEIVSSVAVLATLGYLAIQTQQNTEALQSNSRQEILNAEVDLLYELMDRPFVVEQWRADAVSEDLTEDQRMQLELAGTAYFRMRENLWLQYQNGVIDSATWGTYRDIFVGNLDDSPYLHKQFDRFGERNQFVEGFYEEITEALRSGRKVGGTLLDGGND